MKTFTIFILLLVFPNISFSQKETWNWYFLPAAGITFSTHDTVPVVLEGGRFSNVAYGDSPTIISDKNGNLLFYAGCNHNLQYNGQEIYDPVWNKNQEPMPHSYKIGEKSYALGRMAIPAPGIKNKYYIINDWVYDNDTINILHGCFYDVVDMDKENGLGDVVQRHIKFSDQVRKFYAAIKHSNNIDIWLLTSEEIKEYFYFKSYLVTNRGIIDSNISSGKNEYPLGDYRISPSGSLVANISDDNWTTYDDGHVSFDANSIYINLMSFSKSHGTLGYGKKIHICDTCGGGGTIEFSPNEQKMYVIAVQIHFTGTNLLRDEYSIYQFTVSDDAKVMEKSKVKIASIDDYIGGTNSDGEPPVFWDMKAGPDGKIYVMRRNANYLSAIENPNETADKVKFIEKAVSLGDKKGYGYFPRFLDNYYNVWLELNTSSGSQPTLCEGDSLKLFASLSDTKAKGKYSWAGPNFTSQQQNPALLANANSTGYYVCTTDINGAKIRDSVYVVAVPKPKAEIKGDTVFCLGESTKLSLTNELSEAFKWSTGDTSKEITITQAGYYSVEVENQIGCKDFDTIHVSMLAPDTLEINGKFEFSDTDTGKTNTIIRAIINKGSKNAIIKSILLKNKNGYILTTSEPLPYAIAPKDSLKLYLIFKPVSARDYKDSLFIVTDNICTDNLKIDISGKGKITGIDDTFVDYNVSLEGNYIILKTPELNKTEILLFDCLGNKVRTIYSGLSSAGENKFEINKYSLSAGLYYIQIKSVTFIKLIKYLQL